MLTYLHHDVARAGLVAANAAGDRLADYFHQVMRDTFLPSGRVTYLTVSEVLGDDDGPAENREWEIAGLLSGERRQIRAKKLVDATMLQTQHSGFAHERRNGAAAPCEAACPHGRVQRIEQARIVLDGGEAPAASDTLYVDCTARALQGNVCR